MKNYDVIGLLGLFDKFHLARRVDQIGRVRRYGPSCNDMEVIHTRRHHILFHGHLSHDEISKAFYRITPGITSEQDIRQSGVPLQTKSFLKSLSLFSTSLT